MILDIVKKETLDMTRKADAEISKIGEKYYLTKRDTEPMIYIRLTDNWINFHIRYVTEVHKRRFVHNTLARKILSAIEKSENIELASATYEMVGFPELKVSQVQ